jgi:MFS family permease
VNRIALFVAAAAAFGLSPLWSRLSPVLGAALLVALGIALAFAASGAMTAMAAATGGVGAFAGGVLGTVSPALAGAALLALCYGERTIRVRGTAQRATHVAVALVGGAMAGALSSHYLSADLTVRGVVIVVAAVLAALPLLVEADDPIAHALDELAREMRGPAAATLREGAELRRSVDAPLLDAATDRHAADTWKSLLRLSEARARLARGPGAAQSAHGGAVQKRLDDRLAEHVAALARMYTAVDQAKAAELSLEDGPLRSIETSGESLEQMSKAIVEDVS